MNAVDLFDESARAWPDTPAVIDGKSGRESVVTYAALDNYSRRLACLFANAGLCAGDGIALMLPMSAELYAVIAAAWRLGLVPVFMDPRAGGEQLEHCIRQYPVRAFVGTPAACLLRVAYPALRAIPSAFVSGAVFPRARPLRAAMHLSPLEDTCPCTAATPAMIAFTSGSTGRPKGILRTHGLLLATHAVLAVHIKPERGAVALATLPMFTLTNLACGATSLIPDVDLRRPGRVDPRRLSGQIERWRARSAVASPALLERFADHCLAQGNRIESLREIFVGGAPVFPRLVEKLARVAPQAKVWVLYGSTEAEPIALVSSEEVSAADFNRTMDGGGLLVGRPILEISLRILRDRWGSTRQGDTRETMNRDVLEPGQTGEIVVAGPHVAPAFLGGEGDDETKFRVGDQMWHRTGDAGWLDEQGRLWLLGRCSARIEDAHGTLYPYAVEAALSSHPGIARSAFLLHRGERLLVVEMREGAQPDAHALLRQISWAYIAAVILLKRVPVDARHNAKVDYPALRRALNSGKWLDRIDNRA